MAMLGETLSEHLEPSDNENPIVYVHAAAVTGMKQAATDAKAELTQTTERTAVLKAASAALAVLEHSDSDSESWMRGAENATVALALLTQEFAEEAVKRSQRRKTQLLASVWALQHGEHTELNASTARRLRQAAAELPDVEHVSRLVYEAATEAVHTTFDAAGDVQREVARARASMMAMARSSRSEVSALTVSEQGAWDKLKKKVKQAVEKAVEAAQKAAQRVGEAIQKAAKAVADASADAINKVGDTWSHPAAINVPQLGSCRRE